MKRSAFLATAIAAVAVIILPFASGPGSSGGVSSTSAEGGISFVPSAPTASTADKASQPAAIADATLFENPATVQSVLHNIVPTSPTDTANQKRTVSSLGGNGAVRRAGAIAQGKSCPSNVSGQPNSAPGEVVDGITITTSDDLASFATTLNSIRVANCMAPIPLANIKYDSCLEARLLWMAEDPSPNPLDAWGHTGTAKRSDGVPIVGCDGDLAAGMNDTGATVAQDWWTSIDHRDSLYQPLYVGSLADVCIGFAMTHGGISVPGPNEPYALARAAARWETC